jgi:hypothetical protein|tara:strand:- start:247 stop:1086 length:840 start_codon:yes stop_codon:yes gene_type:complete
MLGKGKALADTGYQAYTGPLVAGTTAPQQSAFSGIAGLTIPTDDMGSFTPQSFTDPGVASQYMNPYLMQALQPQIDEATRQSGIARLAQNKQLSQAGAFGGSRQGIMDSELTRNLMSNLANITGQGYNTAYDRAASQFNKEQQLGMNAADQAQQYGLQALSKQAELGKRQRDIEQQGIDANLAQFEEERLFPYKQVQYMQSLLQNLPMAAQSTNYAQPSDFANLSHTVSGLDHLINVLFGGAENDAGGSGGVPGGGVTDMSGTEPGMKTEEEIYDPARG